MPPAHLEKEAKHTVEADLQRRNAGPLALAGLILGNPGFPARCQFRQFVIAGIKAGPNEPTLPSERRAAIPQGGGDAARQVIAGVKFLCECRQQGRPIGSISSRQAGRLAKQPKQVGEHRRCLTDAFQVPRPGPARDHPASQAFNVANALQQRSHPLGHGSMGNEDRHRIEPAIDGCLVDQGRSQPVDQQPAAHGGAGRVKHPGQRAVPTPPLGTCGSDEFEAATGRLVDFHSQARSPGSQRLDPADRSWLVLFEIGNDATSRSDRQRFRREVKAQPLKADATERGGGFRCRRVILKPPVRPSGDRCFNAGLGERPGHKVAVSLTADNFRSIQPQQMIR